MNPRPVISLRRILERYRGALALLTRLPVGSVSHENFSWGELVPFYPWVGFLIGLFLAAGAFLMNRASPGSPLLSGAFLLALWAGITGALHLDGWMDCADSLFVPLPPARRLEIMSDPHVGAFGVVGLVVLLLIKFSGLTQMMVLLVGRGTTWDLVTALIPFVLVPLIGRMACVIVLLDSEIPCARPEGMGARVRQGLSPKWALISLALGAGLTFTGLWRGLAMVLIGLAVGWSFARWAAKRLGGVTGDVLGGVIEISETAALIAAVWGM